MFYKISGDQIPGCPTHPLTWLRVWFRCFFSREKCPALITNAIAFTNISRFAAGLCKSALFVWKFIFYCLMATLKGKAEVKIGMHY